MNTYFSKHHSHRLNDIFDEIGAVIDDLGPDDEDVAILAVTSILTRENFSPDDRKYLITRIYDEYGLSVF